MKVLIADDEMPARKELGYMVKQCTPEAEIEFAVSGEEVLQKLKEKEYDIVFMDIHLGDMNGMSLVSMLRSEYPELDIIFATAYSDYAVKAFELEAIDYLQKPFELQRVERTMQRVRQQKEHVTPSTLFQLAAEGMNKLPVTHNKNILLLNVNEVIYLETSARNVQLHAKTGEYIGNSSLNYYEERLRDQGFYRIQKSYLINLKQIKEIVPWFNNSYCVRMIGFEDKLLPIGRNQIKELRKIYAF